jgi:hypothetical protein
VAVITSCSGLRERACLVVELAQLRDREPAAAGEVLQQPAGQRDQLLRRAAALRRREHQAVGERAAVDLADRQRVGALLVRRAPQPRDEFAQVAVAVHGLRQHDEGERPRPGGGVRHGHLELRADDQLQPHFLGRDVGAHHAGHRAFVGQRQRGIAQGVRTQHQLVGLAGAAQEREVRQAPQLRIGRDHGVAHGRCLLAL